jgi:hypothetical protein
MASSLTWAKAAVVSEAQEDAPVLTSKAVTLLTWMPTMDDLKVERQDDAQVAVIVPLDATAVALSLYQSSNQLPLVPNLFALV